MTTMTQSEEKASARAWWGLAILALPCMLYSMDLTILNLAMPHVVAALSPSGPQLLWIVDIYGIVLAGALVTMGAIGDRIGRRRLLMLGAVAFGAASVFAAFSQSAEMLILARALLGLAAATLAPSTLSLLSNMFRDSGERALAIGVWIASFSVGGALGPLIGGLLLEHYWWGSVFLVTLPVMGLLLAVGPMILPEFRDPDGGPIDVASAALSIAGMIGLVYGLKHLLAGHSDIVTFAALAMGTGLLAWFVRRQLRASRPMIDMRLFADIGFVAPLGIYFAGLFLAFGSLFLLAQHLQLVLGFGPFEAGLWTLFSATGFVGGSLLGPMAAGRLGAWTVMTLSLLLAVMGYGIVAWSLDGIGLAGLMVGSLLFSLGTAPVLSLSTDLVVGAVPTERAGSAAAVSETGAELGGALGIAVLGSLAMATYRGELRAVLPATLDETERTAALDNLASAMELARSLPEGTADALVAAGRSAFTAAYLQQNLVAAVIALVAAGVAFRLRNR